MGAARKKTWHCIVGCLLFIALFLVQATVPVPRAFAANSAPFTNCTQQAQDVTSSSLLVVLLDRSGSLTTTDPNDYSTSVTKALADLWPGSMAVIPFNNDRVPVWGPYTLSDQQQRETLENAIQHFPVGGDTPLAPAMQKALDLFKHAPAGSRAVIVTDGSPDPPVFAGVNQNDEIEQTLLPQFCAQNIPVSTFGLTLDTGQPNGQLANKLLNDIAARTGGESMNVHDPAELAHVIIQLFSQWLHLSFIQARSDQGHYAIPIDTYAKRVIFVAFRSENSFTITLKGPDAKPLPEQATRLSIDRHYEIANLLVSGANQPGVYSVAMDGDPGAQVYALVETSLHAVLLQPTAQTVLSTGQPLTIQAELQANATPVIPRANEATLNVDVSVVAHGQTVYHTIVELTQEDNGPLFSRQITLPVQTGQLHLQIIASYLQIPVEASDAQISLTLRQPFPGDQGIACGSNAVCSWLISPVSTISGFSGIFLLFCFLLFLLSKKPGGWLLMQNGQTRDLGKIRRPLLRRIFYRSVLHSSELEKDFDFRDAHFELLFKQELRIRKTDDEQSVKIRRGTRTIDLYEEDEPSDIADKDTIIIDKCAPATFIQKKTHKYS